MNCPTCEAELSRTTYENQAVFQCAQCGGYLVDRQDMVVIKKYQGQTREELEAELAKHPGRERGETVKCPKCRARRMDKRNMHVGNSERIQLDLCPSCDVVWFDAGELARMQLHYEQSVQAVQSLAQRDADEIDDPARQAEFEKNLAALPKTQSGVSMAVSEAFQMAMLLVSSLAAVVFTVLKHATPAAVCSGIAVVLLLILSLGATGTAMTRWLVIVVIVAAEAAYLYWLFYMWT